MVSTKEERQKIKLGRYGNTACQNRSSDTTQLSQQACQTLLLLPSPSLNDLLQRYNGDKYKLAYELTRAELGSQGTVEEYRQMYTNTLHNINRYLRKERTPSSEMKNRFKKIYSLESENDLRVYIRGCVRVSNEYYYKDSTWRNPIIVPSYDVKTFLELACENNNAGYIYLNGIYARNSMLNENDFNWLDNVQITMSFE